MRAAYTVHGCDKWFRGVLEAPSWGVRRMEVRILQAATVGGRVHSVGLGLDQTDVPPKFRV